MIGGPSPSRNRLIVLGLGALLVVAGGAVALIPFETADSYCGRPLWDADRYGACADRMWVMTGLALGLVGSGALVLLAAFHWRVPALLAVASFALVAVGTNRLFEPLGCGSVLNRHRTYEASLERACDQRLRPFRNQGVAALSAAGALAIGAVAIGVRRRAGGQRRTLLD
ncbi:MAG: hypothetical protein LC799_27125, partial [Actinobacteria bacterium]|nr:hypothetical protein [Actinomycetota bacterium]